MPSSSLSFVAIDVETANNDRDSVCQVGAVKVIDGAVAESFSYLVVPPTGADSFNARNTQIHGITSRDVLRRGIGWRTCAALLVDFVEDLPVIAHNSRFDSSVVETSCRREGIDAPAWRWEDTLALSRTHLALENYRLPTVSQHLEVPRFKHHDAAADARACAEIALRIADRIVATDFDQLWPSGTRTRRARPAHIDDKTANTKAADLPQPDPSADPDHPLAGQHVVITGALPGMSRWDAFVAIARAGGYPQKGVTLKTTMLVLAEHMDTFTDQDVETTSKGRKALAYRDRGNNIRFLSVSEFQKALAWEAPRSVETGGPALPEPEETDAALGHSHEEPKPHVPQDLGDHQPVVEGPSLPNPGSSKEETTPPTGSPVHSWDKAEQREEPAWTAPSMPDSRASTAPVSTSGRRRRKNLKILGWILFAPTVLLVGLFSLLLIIGLVITPLDASTAGALAVGVPLLLAVPVGIAILGAYLIWIRKYD